MPVEPKGGKGRKGPPSEPKWNTGKGATNPKGQPSIPDIPKLNAPEPTESDVALRGITALLKKSESALPPDVQQWLHTSAAVSSQAATRQLHSAVTQLGVAKQALTTARLARSQMHSAWRNFISQAVATWQQNVQEFTQEDGKLEQEINKAIEALKVARANLEISKQTATTGAPVADGGEISDEEIIDAPGPMIVEDMNAVLQSLGQLKQKADASLETEMNTKRFKTGPSEAKEVKEEQETPSGPSHPSLQAFGRPGQ